MSLRLGRRPGIVVAGTGAAFPSDLGAGSVLTNAGVYETLRRGADSSWDGPRTDRDPEAAWGVSRREWLDPDGDRDLVGELAAGAAANALASAEMDAMEIDVILVATSTPARVTSSLAAAMGKLLGSTAACLDIRAGGTGGLAAWISAARYLGDDCPTALVVAVETSSRFLDPEDLSAALIYGDGAAALVLRWVPDAPGGQLAAVLGRADAGGQPFTVPGPLPPRREDVDAGRFRFQRPDAVYLESLDRTWGLVCAELRSLAGEATVDHFLPYAVTRPQVEAAATAFGALEDSTFTTLERHGCLGCAGPLVAVDVARREHRILDGEVVALAAVAGGVSTAGLLWRM